MVSSKLKNKIDKLFPAFLVPLEFLYFLILEKEFPRRLSYLSALKSCGVSNATYIEAVNKEEQTSFSYADEGTDPMEQF